MDRTADLKPTAFLLILLALPVLEANDQATSPGTDWPYWRGPNGNGIAECTDPPVKWSETENIIWSVDVPGRGHSSPAVVADRIFLTSADEKRKEQCSSKS